MNWGKMKNVMIAFLVVLNLILLTVLYAVESDNTTLSAEEVKNAARVLRNHGISVNEEMIPTRRVEMGNLPMVAATQSHEKFVTVFLGTTYEHQREEDTLTNVYTFGEKTVRLNGGYIKYYSGREAGEVPSEDLWRSVRNKIEDAGISLKDAVETKSSEYERRYLQQYKGKDFFEGNITVTADKSGILSVEGFWMVPGGKEFGKESVSSVTEAFSAFLQDEERDKKSVEITDITLGYSVLLGEEQINFSEATAIPVWRLTTSDGKSYYYDARAQ